MMGHPAQVSSGAFSSPAACDGDGDGDWDLLIGNEMGFVHLCENVGTKERPVFEPGKPLKTVDGAVLRIMREDILHDADSERYCGQTKVVFADWDRDGLPDLILGNNTNRIFFCKNVGKLHQPQFTQPVAIKVEGVADPFGWRFRPSVVHWDGDGLPDLVAVRPEGVIYNVPQKLDRDLRRIWDGFEEQKPWNVGITSVQFRKGVYDEFAQAL